MPSRSYAEVLEEAKGVSAEDQQRLIEALEQVEPTKLEEKRAENGKVLTLYDAMNERGLIGFMEDAPPNLSTNPKYMEGFGRDAG